MTGIIDESTVDLLKKPRCGVPDVSHAGYRNRRNVANDNDNDNDNDETIFSHRTKRYSLQGERWSHTNLTWNLKALPPLPASPDYLDKDLIRRELGYALELWAR